MQPAPLVSYGPGLPQLAASVAPQHEVGLRRHHRRTMTILSGLQIAIGISCTIIYIVLISIGRQSVGRYLDVVGAGIWCGGLYIIAGSLGVAAARQSRLSLMISSMVFCILSSLALWVVVGFALVSVLRTVQDEKRPCSSGGGDYPYYNSLYCYSYSFSGYKTADSILLILSAIELIISIWCSVLCCKGSCKACCRGCCYESNYGYQTQVIYTPFHSTGQHVMFVQHSGVVSGPSTGVLPNQPFYVGMQPLVNVAPAAAPLATGTTPPPRYQPAVSGFPEYAMHIGNVAASSAAYGQTGEVTKEAMVFDH